MDFKVLNLSNLIIVLFTPVFLGWACEGRIYRDHVFHESHVKGGILYIGNNLDWLQEDSAHFRRYGFSSILVEIDNETELERFFTGNFSRPPLLEDSTNTSIILLCGENAFVNSSLLMDLLKEIPSGKKEKDDFRNSHFGRISSFIVGLREDIFPPLKDREDIERRKIRRTNLSNSLKSIGGQMNLIRILFGLGFPSIGILPEYLHMLQPGEVKVAKNLISIAVDIYDKDEDFFHYEKFSLHLDDVYKSYLSVVKRKLDTFEGEVVIRWKFFRPLKYEFSLLRKYGQIISQFVYTWGHLTGRRVTFSEIPEDIDGLDSWLNYTVSYSSRSVYKPVIKHTGNKKPGELFIAPQFIAPHTLIPPLCEKYEEIIVDIKEPSEFSESRSSNNELIWRHVEFGKFLSQLMNGSCNSQISVRMSMSDPRYNQVAGYFVDHVLNQTLQAALKGSGYLKSVFFSPAWTCDEDFSRFRQFIKFYTDKWQLTNYSNLSIGIFGHCLHLAREQVDATRKMFGSSIRLGFVEGRWSSELLSNVEQSSELGRLASNQDEILLEMSWQTDLNCYDDKVNWRTAVNLAFIYGYKVFQERPDVVCSEECKDTVWNQYTIGFAFGLVDQLILNANSNEEETCVLIDGEVSTSLIQFNRSLSGTSLNIMQSFYQNMQAKEIVALLELIHLRFDRIEIILDCGEPTKCLEMVKLFQEAVSILEELVGRERFKTFKYYFNLARFSAINYSGLISHLKSIDSGALQGIHFELSNAIDFEANKSSVDSLCKSGKSFDVPIGFGQMESSLKSIDSGTPHEIHFELSNAIDFGAIKSSVDSLSKSGKSFGVAIDFVHLDNAESLLAEKVVPLVPLCNYVIFNVCILEVLTPQISNAYNIYETMSGEERDFESTFHQLFERLRVYRFKYEQLNQNVTIILRFGWPTLTRKRKGFNSEYRNPRTDDFLGPLQSLYLRIWKFIEEYSSTFNFPIIINQAFDDEESEAPEKDYEKYLTERLEITEGLKYGYGWWTIHNYSDVANLQTITEKQADYLGIPTERPKVGTEPKNEARGDDNFYKIISIAVSVDVIGFIALVISGVFFFFRWRYSLLSKQEILEFKYGKVPSSVEYVDDKEEFNIFGVRYDKEKYEISKKEFSNDLSCVIGEGNFGTVYKMEMARFDGAVAVKMPKISDASSIQTALRSLLHEIKIMSYVGEHRNIVTLLGAYTREIHRGMVWVVTEYCERGSLRKHLRKANKDEACDRTYELYRYCQEIASGMAYLAEKRVIHGDLAARNVLLDKDYTCKISDFGLSRMLKEQYSEYVKKTKEPLPWAWLAPESLNDFTFTLKSDVWSIGITFWEVFTSGDKPYFGLTWDVEFYGRLKNGMRLPKPDGVDDETYALIRSCWELEPDSRPDPPELANFFQQMRSRLYEDLQD